MTPATKTARRSSISQRFILWQGVIVALILVVFFVIFIGFNARLTEKTLNEQADHILAFSKKSLVTAMWQYNHEYVADYVDSLLLYRDMLYVTISIESQMAEEKYRAGFSHIDFTDEDVSDEFIVRESSVVYHGEKIGHILFAMGKTQIAQQMLRNSLAAAFLLLFVAALISITVVVLFRNNVLQPLVRLENTARKIAGGDLETPIDTSSNDEIGQLAGTLNLMMQNIRSITASRDELNTEVAERKRAEITIQQNLKEKEVLLKEIHHRVKNNLQLIQSLLNLQAETIKSEDAKRPFIESTNRIKSMALIHETLYRADDMGHLDAAVYFDKIVQHLVKIYHSSDLIVEVDVDVQSFDLEMDYCVSCGLILTELVSNAFKYAFKDQSTGKLSVQFVKKNPSEAVLTVMDNGSGFPEDFNIEETDSLGLRIVKLITVGQLEGELHLNQARNTRIDIRFPL